jgi:hypothetical protein
MRKLLLCLLVCLPLTVTWAVGEKTFQWTPPTQYEDGTNLPQEDIASYNIECSNGWTVNVPNEPLNTDTYEAPAGTFEPGTYSCVGYTLSTAGVSSRASEPVNFTVEPGVPNPPIFVVQ